MPVVDPGSENDGSLQIIVQPASADFSQQNADKDADKEDERYLHPDRVRTRSRNLSIISQTKNEPVIIEAATVTEVFLAFCAKLKEMSIKEYLWIALLIALQMSGMATQIIALNFWQKNFKDNKGAYVSFAVSILFFGTFFAVVLLVYWIAKRPSLRFLFCKRSIVLLVIIGLFDALNSDMSVHAVNETPEVLQAIFMAMQSVWTVIFVKMFVHDTRTYSNPWVYGSLALIVSGVLAASFNDFTNVGSISANQRWWSVVYFFSVPTMAVYNVLQERYMHELTEGVDPTIDAPKGDDTTVKIAMLFGDTGLQVLWCALLFPCEAIPWYGTDSTMGGVWNTFADGLSNIFTDWAVGRYATLYCMGFIFMYIGAVYLNDYSAALSSMIAQLSSPVTALIIIIIPQWNEQQDNTPWFYSIAAVFLLVIGTFLWAVWEELSRYNAVDTHEDTIGAKKKVGTFVANDGDVERAPLLINVP